MCFWPGKVRQHLRHSIEPAATCLDGLTRVDACRHAAGKSSMRGVSTGIAWTGPADFYGRSFKGSERLQSVCFGVRCWHLFLGFGTLAVTRAPSHQGTLRHPVIAVGAGDMSC